MRLINVHTLELKEFLGDSTPDYAILSHRWSDDEISYKDFAKGRRTESAGYRKVVDFCHFVRTRSTTIYSTPRRRLEDVLLEWAWVDTCCIDRRSSAELSEAINSMYSWYGKAAHCIAYLPDVSYLGLEAAPSQAADRGPAAIIDDASSTGELRNSAWFTRGWTLQELLAPRIVVFCSADWIILGHKCHSLQADCTHAIPHYGPYLNEHLSQITHIKSDYLRTRTQIARASIACRMHWASSRTTTRIEDLAYSLLGIFQVNLPLVYGEGDRAFLRLQHEIIRRSTDQSILAWKRIGGNSGGASVLARLPKYFDHPACGEMEHLTTSPRTPYTVTNAGLQITLQASSLTVRPDGLPNLGEALIVARLNCGRHRSSNREDPDADRVLVPEELYLKEPDPVQHPKHCVRAARANEPFDLSTQHRAASDMAELEEMNLWLNCWEYFPTY